MPDEYVGGMTPQGVNHLYTFVQNGGTLVALDSATSLPLTTFGLPARNVTEGPRENEYFIPGTIVRLQVDPTHPVGYGMPPEVGAFFAHSAAFALGRPRGRGEVEPAGRPQEPAGVRTVATYAVKDLLMSGWLMGERVIAGRAAVVDASVGQGRVVLLGFRVQHRAQPHATFKLLFNSLLLPPPVARAATGATSPSRSPR
jgi:hypothetical protein